MDTMILQGSINKAKIFTHNIEENAIGQIIGMLNEPITKNTTVAIMPDVHYGKGSTVGTTIKLPDNRKDWKVCPNVVGIDIGCLDKDTEILTPNGWLKINQYENQEILIYEPQTNKAIFEKPKAYIKLPCSNFFHYVNSKGMNQMVSEEHTMLVYKGYKSRGFNSITLHPNELNQFNLDKGYYTTKTTFQVDNKGVDLTDTELRLRVMIQADGSIKRGNFIDMHFIKERKIERCINLLKDADIDYKIVKHKNKTTNITFYADHLRRKSLTDLYAANVEQLKIIAEESLLWDGHKGYRSYYSTTQKDEADFIQYAFNASGTRASIFELKETRKGREHHSKTYNVIPTKNEYVAYCQPITVNSEDGYKYCFTTSTGFFIARRNNHIFTTGNCSMRAIRLDITGVDLEKLDDVVTKEIITGRKHLSKPLCNVKEIKALLSKLSFKLTNEQISQAIHSCGTLGGGNHYLELGKSPDGQLWLTVHSGSRTLGIAVATHHSNVAFNQNSDVKNKNFSYLEGELLKDYLNDLNIAQKFSTISRKLMLYKIAEKMNWKIIDEFESMHNYIDIKNGIIRKGATSAQAGERLIIPLNMRDGSIFATGKGNPEWNFSAPHGAGRKLSRGVAKNFISIDEYRETMKGIYSTSISQSTLDESPFAYKESQEIIDAIADTVNIDMIVKPIYNFKAH